MKMNKAYKVLESRDCDISNIYKFINNGYPNGQAIVTIKGKDFTIVSSKSSLDNQIEKEYQKIEDSLPK